MGSPLSARAQLPELMELTRSDGTAICHPLGEVWQPLASSPPLTLGDATQEDALSPPEPMELSSGCGTLADSRHAKAAANAAAKTTKTTGPPLSRSPPQSSSGITGTGPSTIVPATQAPMKQTAPHVHYAILASRNLSIELERLSRNRPDATTATQEAFDKLARAIQALGLRPGQDTNKHASGDAPAARHMDALRRAVRQEVRAEIQAAEDSTVKSSYNDIPVSRNLIIILRLSL